MPPSAFPAAVVTGLPDLLPCGSGVGTGCSDLFHFKSYLLLDALSLAWGTPGLLPSSASSLSASGAPPPARAAPADPKQLLLQMQELHPLSVMLIQSFQLQPSCTLTRTLPLLQRARLPSSHLSCGLNSPRSTRSVALFLMRCVSRPASFRHTICQHSLCLLVYFAQSQHLSS